MVRLAEWGAEDDSMLSEVRATVCSQIPCRPKSERGPCIVAVLMLRLGREKAVLEEINSWPTGFSSPERRAN